MSIEASYRRVSPAKFSKLTAEPEAALFTLQPLLRFPDDPEKSLAHMRAEEDSGLVFRLGKEWHALHFLLTGEADLDKRIAPPLGDIVLGGTPTPIEATYGAVRYLTNMEVRAIAGALRSISVEELAGRFDPNEFNAHRIYPNPRPGGWNELELEALLELYPRLVEFFTRAGEAGDLVLISSD
jgi:hypothetical protein